MKNTLRRRALLAGGAAGGALALAACTPTRALNALLPRGTYELNEGLAYGDDPRHRLDVYRPTGAVPAGGHPLVLFFYGGSWNRGERADYRFVGEALASRGMLAMVADYRLYPRVRYPDFLLDGAAAMAYALREAPRFGGDAGRAFVMGHSAGAYNAAMLALDERWLATQGLAPERLAGWIGLAGPYDFTPIVDPEVRPVFHHPDVPPSSQPIFHAHERAIPTFLGAAPKDSYVNPQRNTARLAQALRAAGTEVTLRWYEDVSHLTLAAALAHSLRWMAPVLEDVAAFVAADKRA